MERLKGCVNPVRLKGGFGQKNGTLLLHSVRLQLL